MAASPWSTRRRCSCRPEIRPGTAGPADQEGRPLHHRGEIARGGMGAVLRAVDCDIRREVAVKYLLDQADAGKKARFVEEAQITGQLEHPNIVPIHELGVDARKRLFFSMKMVKGRSLAQVLDELRQNPKTAEKEYSLGRLLNVFVNVCNALAYAHSRGVVHRDLKPANIMVGDFGEVYVMDWGLAKVLKAGGQPAPPAPMATVAASRSAAVPLSSHRPNGRARWRRAGEPEADLTQEGAVLGTPVYMPPEQATGKVEAIDQRSDVYSLGAILYEMLTLQPPIDKEGGYLAVLMRVMQGEIVPPEQRARAGKIPQELSAVAMKALAKNPQDRYPTVEALRQDIERFQEGRSVSAKEDTSRRRSGSWSSGTRWPVPSRAVLAVVLVWGSVVNWLARRERTPRPSPGETGGSRSDGESGARPVAVGPTSRWRRASCKEALEQVEFALKYEPRQPRGDLFKGSC